MSHLVSPDSLVDAAVELMPQLECRPRAGESDKWVYVMNFLAANIDRAVRHSACQVFNALYSMGLTEEEVTAIVAFQTLQEIGE